MTTWRRWCTTFTGCESRNESRLGWRFWRTAVRMDLHNSIQLMTFTIGGGQVTATAAFGGDCGTDRPRNGPIYVRRSRFLCSCRSSVEEPSTLGYVISNPSGSPEASEASSFACLFVCLFVCLLLNDTSATIRLLVLRIVEILLEPADVGGPRRQPEERVT